MLNRLFDFLYTQPILSRVLVVLFTLCFWAAFIVAVVKR
jgi:hypothetical protein